MSSATEGTEPMMTTLEALEIVSELAGDNALSQTWAKRHDQMDEYRRQQEALGEVALLIERIGKTDPQNGKTKLVEDLVPGDMIDLEGDKFADPDANNPVFDCELCIVAGSARETDTCIRIDLEGLNSVGFPPGHRVRIGGFDTEYAAAVAEETKA
jgi:hypothetical protein